VYFHEKISLGVQLTTCFRGLLSYSVEKETHVTNLLIIYLLIKKILTGVPNCPAASFVLWLGSLV
jgi:hypothetical protein